MTECEKCYRKYNCGINGSTLVGELGEYSLCDYCSQDFNEIEFRNEVGLSNIILDNIQMQRLRLRILPMNDENFNKIVSIFNFLLDDRYKKGFMKGREVAIGYNSSGKYLINN